MFFLRATVNGLRADKGFHFFSLTERLVIIPELVGVAK